MNAFWHRPFRNNILETSKILFESDYQILLTKCNFFVNKLSNRKIKLTNESERQLIYEQSISIWVLIFFKELI